MSTQRRAQPPITSLQAFRRQTLFIYLALAVSLVLGAIGALVAHSAMEMSTDESLKTTILPIAIVLTALTSSVVIFLPHTVYRACLKGLRGESVQAKLQAYATSRVLLAALCEGPGLFWAVLMLLFGEPLYLLGPALSFGVMLTRVPTAMDLESTVQMRLRDIENGLNAPE